ncbi:DUF4352 domain-containing protein [Lactococcus garvieae]|uniref:DUF4352 domain-containing protein n=1 Tax=Lactococcus garvieae TaxID=1363 RepID=UPI00031331B8|nr:DUF4352 domain-containing protein [Lactococcus garvieae]
MENNELNDKKEMNPMSEKTPIYKLVLFWLLLTSIAITIVFIFISSVTQNKLSQANSTIESLKKSYEKESSFNYDFNTYMRENVPDYVSYVDKYLGNSSSESEENNNQTSTEQDTYTNKFGTAQEFTGNDTQLSVNVISAVIDPTVELDSEAPAGVKPLVVTVSIKNIGKSSYSFNIQSFNAYDNNGNTLNFSSSTYHNTMPNSVNAGQTVTAKAYFEATDDGPFSITFADGTWK